MYLLEPHSHASEKWVKEKLFLRRFDSEVIASRTFQISTNFDNFSKNFRDSENF